MPTDLIEAQKLIYEPHGWLIKKFEKEVESEEYEACIFEMNDRRIKFRTAKITPTKIGQFVTLWKRIGRGPIMPYDVADPIDLFIVSVKSEQHFGQFVFPKDVLYEKGILSKDGKGGKRAIRVYPLWDKTDNTQAKKTQAWQLQYFFEILQNKDRDAASIKKLFF